MSASRTSILTALGGETLTPGAQARLNEPVIGPLPAFAQLDGEARIKLFIDKAEQVASTVARLPRWNDVPKAIADYLGNTNHQFDLKIAPHPDLENVPWSEQSTLSVEFGAATPQDSFSLTRGFAGVAESGTLVLISAPETPTALNFLPDTQIVALPTAAVERSYEAVWAAMRARNNALTPVLPRTVNWVTGPSRTGDIDQTLLLGVHGPRRLHILLIDEETQPQNP